MTYLQAEPTVKLFYANANLALSNVGKVDKKLFGTKTVRVKRGRHTKKIRLRIKRSKPQRLRESGGDIKVLTPPEPEKKLKKTGRKSSK